MTEVAVTVTGRLVARALAAREGRLERRGLPRGQAGQRLVEALEHVARADLVADAGDLVDLLAVDRRGEVEHDEVALGGRAVDADERAEALAQRVQAALHVLVGDLEVVDRDGDGVERRHLDLRADLDLRREVQVALGVPSATAALRDLDLRLAERAQVRLVHGLAVEVGHAVVDRVLQHRRAADALVDDPGRDLALAEAGTVTCSAMCAYAWSMLGLSSS